MNELMNWDSKGMFSTGVWLRSNLSQSSEDTKLLRYLFCPTYHLFLRRPASHMHAQGTAPGIAVLFHRALMPSNPSSLN
jgi:hypothetical protein